MCCGTIYPRFQYFLWENSFWITSIFISEHASGTDYAHKPRHHCTAFLTIGFFLLTLFRELPRCLHGQAILTPKDFGVYSQQRGSVYTEHGSFLVIHTGLSTSEKQLQLIPLSLTQDSSGSFKVLPISFQSSQASNFQILSLVINTALPSRPDLLFCI